jgi:hypothetical protein
VRKTWCKKPHGAHVLNNKTINLVFRGTLMGLQFSDSGLPNYTLLLQTNLHYTALLYYTTLYYTILLSYPYCTTLYHTILPLLYYTIPILLYSTIPYYLNLTVLHYPDLTLLYHTIPYYPNLTVLHYTTLYQSLITTLLLLPNYLSILISLQFQHATRICKEH